MLYEKKTHTANNFTPLCTIPFVHRSNRPCITSIQRSVIAIKYYHDTLSEGLDNIFKGFSNSDIVLPKKKLKGIILIEHQAYMCTFVSKLRHKVEIIDDFIIITTCGTPDKLCRMLLVQLNELYHLPLFILRDSDSGGIINTNLIRFGNQTLVCNECMSVPHAIVLPITGVCYKAGHLRTTGNGGRVLTPKNITIAENIMKMETS